MTELVFRDDALCASETPVVSAALGRVALTAVCFTPLVAVSRATRACWQAGGTGDSGAGHRRARTTRLSTWSMRRRTQPAVGTHVTARIDWESAPSDHAFSHRLCICCARWWPRARRAAG